MLISLALIGGLLMGCGGGPTPAPSGGASGGEQPAAASPGEGASEGQPAAPASGEGGGEPPAAPPGAEGDADWAATREAFFAVSQLAIGSLYLQDTPNAITPEQAATLLPLWQELKSMQESGPMSAEDIAATVAQIEAAMTPEQLDAITALSQEDLQAWAQEQGLGFGPGGPPQGERPMGTPPGEPPGGTPPGDWPTPSPEEIATRQAEGGGIGPGGPGMPMVDAVIEMLEALVNG
jgi:hypothetical protein